MSALQHVPPLSNSVSEDAHPMKSHTIWMGTDSHRLLIYSGLEPEKQTLLSSTSLAAAITTIKYHCDQVRMQSEISIQLLTKFVSGIRRLKQRFHRSLSSRNRRQLVAERSYRDISGISAHHGSSSHFYSRLRFFW